MSEAKKLIPIHRLSKILEKYKKDGKKIVHCHGVFDLLHVGHIRYFKSAKKYGDILVVTMTADKYVKRGPGRPYFKENLRAEVLSSIEVIDYISISDAESAVPAILSIKPDYYIKGPDYKNRKKYTNIPQKLAVEKEAVEKNGGKMVFTDDVVFSSSSLINTYLDSYPPKTQEYLKKFKQKHTSGDIIEKLNNLTNARILIVGDAIIDQYHYCVPLGRSSKEPIMVHRYMSAESFAGGALASANHLAALSKNITLLTVLGKKRSFKNFIMKHLKSPIKPIFYYQQNADTIIKRRYLDAFTRQKQFQLTYIRDGSVCTSLENEIIDYLKINLKNFDLVLVNDFGHGFLTDKIVRVICNKANFLALNVQSNSANYGFNVVTKYPRADYVCIDELEIRLAMHDKYSDLQALIKKIHKRMKCKEMVVTRGAEGSLNYSVEKGFIETPALTDRIIDRVGAGDALFAISSPCKYEKMDSELIAFIGNVAGALQVQIIGNKKPVELADMAKFITRLLK